VSLFSPQILLRRFSLKVPAGQDEVKDKVDERSQYQDNQSIFHEYYIVTFRRPLELFLVTGFPPRQVLDCGATGGPTIKAT
jgi:hypothetical protein